MSSSDVVRHCWGQTLVRLSSRDLSQCRLPASSFGFLKSVGLPEGNEIVRQLKLGIEFTPRATARLERSGGCLLQVGVIELDPGSLDICIKESSGEVYCVPPRDEAPGPCIVMNSSIEALLHFLAICLQSWPQIETLSEGLINVPEHLAMSTKRHRNLALREQYMRSVEKLKDALIAVDAWAFEEEQYYWPMVFRDWSL